MRVLVLTVLVVAAAATENYFRLPQPYSYNCRDNLCTRQERSQSSEYSSLQKCQLTCGEYASLWPQPTGETQIANDVVYFNPYNMQVTKMATSNPKVAQMLDEATRYFKRNIHFMHPNFPQSHKTPYTEDVQTPFEDYVQRDLYDRFSHQQLRQRSRKRLQPFGSSRFSDQESQAEFSNIEKQTYEDWERYSPFKNQEYNAGTERQQVDVEITVTSPEERLSIQNTDESFNLVVQTIDDRTTVTILATTYYGARHALESLSQLIAYDDDHESLMLVKNAKIQDQPQYKYRALLLDTGRNYYSKEELMSLLDSMSQNKMNVFHWHLTDSASFPLYSNRVPKMTYYGAYSPRKVYYPEDIRDIVRYARLRGITVIPELDAPAHTGSGWEWGEKEGKGKLVLCNSQKGNEPWFEVGKEPPSGQLNPVNPELYSVLGQIYSDIVEYFDPEFFHMGGDDVSFKCWQNSEEIKQYMSANQLEPSSREYFELWNTFQSNAYAKLQEATPSGHKVTPIIYSSSFARNYVDKQAYVVHLTEKANENSVADYVSNGFKVIFSNPDQWRLDCGGTNWFGDKAESCPAETPTWKHFYGNSPLDMLFNLGITNARSDLPNNRPTYQSSQTGQQQQATENPKDFVLGGTATMWSPETDGNSIQAKIWPRVSAFAERLWTDPLPHTNPIFDTAQKRLNIQRERMVDRGIKADPVQPAYCMHNEHACFSREEYQLRSESHNTPSQ